MLLETDKFLNELGKLYERNKTSGTVYITMKRSNMKPKPKSKGKGKEKMELDMSITGEDFACLIRATDGKKTISAVVDAKDHMRFQASYTVLLKAHMDALKKREREKKKKATPKATPATN